MHFSENDQSLLMARNPEINRVAPGDRPVHDWYRFVLSYPPHLVREYLARFELKKNKHRILDPFCGTGTTVVEARKNGFASWGIEAHPMTHFAAATKVKWDLDPKILRKTGREIAENAERVLERQGVFDSQQGTLLRDQAPLLGLPEEESAILLAGSICPIPLHRVLVLRDEIRRSGGESTDHLLLALARELTLSIGNLHFGPEVGVSAPKGDVPVVEPWLSRVERMADDIEQLGDRKYPSATVLHADARSEVLKIRPGTIDCIITSPPYPNEKDYTRTTRLESVLLGFLRNKVELQALKRGMLLRSNTRNVYKADDDERWILDNAEIQCLAETIEQRRIALGKTSGFERLYARVTKLYFGGMARHFSQMRPLLRSGARLVYVVGDQASYLRVMIRTGQLLAGIAENLGYEVEGIDLFRTRISTATKEQLREEALILKWVGKK